MRVSNMNKLSFSRKSEGTLLKMFMTQEMTKDLESLETIDVLNSNHHLFLKLLQDPNSQLNLITVLKPSKMVVNRKKVTKSSPNNQFGLSPKACTQPTRIVVLKPTHGMMQDDMAVVPYKPSSPTIPSSESDTEARKRLSERWAVMAANGSCGERRNGPTLGEMLALSKVKDPEICGSSHGSLVRSKSVPVEAFSGGNIIDGPTKQVAKSSLRGKVASLFSRRNKKPCNGMIDPYGMFFDNNSDTQPPTLNSTNRTLSLNLKLHDGQSQSLASQQVAWSTLKTSTPNTSCENQEQPSPISVLEPKFEEEGRSNLIDKSPPIGSIARTLSWTESPTTGSHDEGPWLFLVQSLLSTANITEWHSPNSPLDPSLREKYAAMISKQPFCDEANRRRLRSNCWLIFDCVNAALVDEQRLETTVDRVWGGMKDWFLSGGCEVEDGGGDNNSVAVERVVRKELGGRDWDDLLKVEIDIIGEEIEGRLIKELVEESVDEWILF